MQSLKLLFTNFAIFALNAGVFASATIFQPGFERDTAAQPVPHPKPAVAANVVEAMIDLHLPTVEYHAPKQIFTATLYAYSSTPDQTNGDPFITASGQRVADGIVANNCLPFGTQVEINNKLYTVQDRMAARYGCTSFDVWHPSRESAIQFGKQTAVVEVY